MNDDTYLGQQCESQWDVGCGIGYLDFRITFQYVGLMRRLVFSSCEQIIWSHSIKLVFEGRASIIGDERAEATHACLA